MSYTFEQMLNPEKYDLEMCSHCDGYGSSLKDPIGVDKCTQCGGTGLTPKKSDLNPTRKLNLEEGA